MPNVKSAEKRMRTNKLREQRNKQKRSRLRTALKKAHQAGGESAAEAMQTAVSLLDRAAAKRLIHPNKAARLKSRLAREVRAKAATA